jgi:hypothetical protein
MATAGGARMICWPMAQQQGHVRGSGASSSSGGHAFWRRCPDRLQLSRVVPVAVATPSQLWVQRSGGARGNLVLCSGKFELRAIRGSTRAVSQVVEATTAGLRETVEDTAIVDGHSRSFEGIHTEEGACPADLDQSSVFPCLTSNKMLFFSLLFLIPLFRDILIGFFFGFH